MNFVRGLLLYNTVYWKRASDGLKPPGLSRRDRLAYQPARDLEIIKPRERPRARLAAVDVAEALPTPALHMPEPPPPVENDAPAAPVPPVAGLSIPPAPVLPAAPMARLVPLGVEEGQVIIKRRRSRRRQARVLASSGAVDPAADVYEGWFARLFRRGAR